MLLSTTSVKRPVFATVVNLMLVVLGLVALWRLPVRQYPDIDPPVVSITTAYLGASAQVVETELTKRIEEAVSGIEGVRLISSTSREEVSQIDVEFRIGRDIDFAAADVRDAIARIRRQFPEGIDDPSVAKASSSANPVVWIGLQSDGRDALQLTDWARRSLVDSLSVVPGVSRVIIGGERRYAVRIWLDPDALSARGLTVADVRTRLADENLELPAGRIESVNREISVRTTTRLRTVADFAGLVLRDAEGAQVRLGDVARVVLGAENERTGLWIDGRTAIGLGVIRQSTANTLEVADGVRAALARLGPAMPADIRVIIPYDESVFIATALREVLVTLAIALALVVGVVLLFLGSWRATLAPAISIPVSLVATGIVMWAGGFSINVLTLLALVLAIGLVVDDAIVVIENIHRRMELGEARLVAAVRGTSEVGLAVLATTLVLIATFIPLAFQQGTIGRLFGEFGLTMAAAVGFSGLTALTLAPMLASKLLRATHHAVRPGQTEVEGEDGLFARIARGYRAVVGWSLRQRVAVIAASALLGLAAVALWRMVPDEKIPVEDRGFVVIVLEAPQGATMDYTLARVREVEAVLAPLRGDDGPVAQVLAVVAPTRTANAPVNSGFVIVRLKPWDQRGISQQAVTRQLMPRLLGAIGGLSGARIIPINPPSFGSGFGQQVQFALGGTDGEEVARWSGQLLASLRASGAFADLREEADRTKPQLVLEVDRDRAAALGVSAAEIGAALQVLYGAEKLTKWEDRGEQYEVMLQAEAATRSSPRDLARVQVRSAAGSLVPLSTVVTYREIGVAKDLTRVDRLASSNFSATPRPGFALGEAMALVETTVRSELPPSARLTWLGQAKDAKEASAGGLLTFLAALAVAYLVLAAQFESFIHPLTILVAVPLAVTGALAALALTGQPLNLYSQIGLVMLVGLMAKNGILMVEFANQLRDRGLAVAEAITDAAVIRLRPILMTSVAAVAGALPLALGSGAGAEGRRAIGIVVIGGVTLSTVMTLLIIPVLYALLARFTRPANAVAEELARLEKA